MFIIDTLIKMVPGLIAPIGDAIVKYHDTTTKQQGDQDKSGAQLAAGWLTNISETNRIKAEARATEGKWGPMGVLSFAIGSAFVYHTWQVVLDSSAWHLTFTGFEAHRVGSWRVAALPGLWETTEHMVLQSFFYVGGALAGVSTLAKVFRR